MDSANCQNGTPKGIRTIIATGEVNGMIENQNESELSGKFKKD